MIHIEKEKNPLIVFLTLLVLRAIPEVISYPYPIGFDTLMYSTFYLDYKGMPVSTFLQRLVYPAPILLRTLLYIVANTTPLTPFLFFKLYSILIYALFGLSVYVYSFRRITHHSKSVIIISLLISYHYSILRISWELHRNMLSFVFLVLFLAYYPPQGKKETVYMVLAMIGALLSHQTSAVIIFLLSITVLFLNLINRQQRNKKLILLNLLLLPWLTLMVLYYIGFFWRLLTSSPYPPLMIPPSNPKFILDYPSQLLHTFSLFLLLLGPLLMLLKKRMPLSTALKSSFNKIFVRPQNFVDIITFYWLLLISFSPLFLLNAAPPYWYRWLILAPFFLHLRILKTMVINNKLKITHSFKRWSLLIIFGSSTFLAFPAYLPPPYFLSPTTIKYFPPTMLYNTVPLEDSSEIVQLMHWIDPKLNSSACLLTLEETYGWARNYLSNETFIVYTEYNLTKGIELAKSRNFTYIFFIWWRNDLLKLLMFTSTVPSYFVEIYSLDRMAVYLYIVS